MDTSQSFSQKSASLTGSSESWQAELANSVTDPAALIRRLKLDPRLLPAARQAARAFPLRVTQHFLALIEPSTPDDPLLRQVLPLGAELDAQPGFIADPVDDAGAFLGQGLLQKYRGRALLVTTGACAIHCRFCFRRHFPYAEHALQPSATATIARRLAAKPDTEEIILSGGDPLALSDRRLAKLIGWLESVAHIRRLRLHTRLPVALPSRMTPRLLRLLERSRLQVVVVVHSNHARELHPALTSACARLRSAGATLLNQSVLLRGVNDCVATLSALSNALFDAGILPYYLHQLDPVAGAAHFLVPRSKALHLHAALRAELPGYMVPKLVAEMPGAHAKTALAD